MFILKEATYTVSKKMDGQEHKRWVDKTLHSKCLSKNIQLTEVNLAEAIHFVVSLPIWQEHSDHESSERLSYFGKKCSDSQVNVWATPTVTL